MEMQATPIIGFKNFFKILYFVELSAENIQLKNALNICIQSGWANISVWKIFFDMEF